MTLMLRQRPVPLPVPHDRTSTVDPHTDPLAYAPPPFRCRERTRTSKCIYGLRILNICQKTQILISSHPNKRGSRSVPSWNADRSISSPLWPPSLMGWINQPPRPCRENNHPPRRRREKEARARREGESLPKKRVRATPLRAPAPRAFRRQNHGTLTPRADRVGPAPPSLRCFHLFLRAHPLHPPQSHLRPRHAASASPIASSSARRLRPRSLPAPAPFLNLASASHAAAFPNGASAPTPSARPPRLPNPACPIPNPTPSARRLCALRSAACLHLPLHAPPSSPSQTLPRPASHAAVAPSCPWADHR
jgi:hypothetical protein